MNKIITIVLCLISVLGYSQNLIGYSKEEIKKELKESDPYCIIEDEVNDDGVKYLLVSSKNSNLTKGYYLNKNDICYTYCFIGPYKYLNDFIQSMNDKFVKISDEVWYDYARDFNFKWELSRYEHSFMLTITIKQ